MRKRKALIVFALVSLLTVFVYISGVSDIFNTRPLPTFVPNKESYVDASWTVSSNCTDVVYGNYCVISVPSEAERSDTSPGSVTLCTQGTVDFLQHVSVLCKRWGGPISVAVHSPPLDFLHARDKVDALQRCDFCVRHWVSWHFFGKNVSGKIDTFAESRDVPIPWDCEMLSPSGGGNAKRKPGSLYLINVGRNLARKMAHTPYVFSLDIELYPSPGVLPKFERMLRSQTPSKLGDAPQVWVLPVFEVHSNFSVPETKFQLRIMHKKGIAISFHKYRCNMCHMIPNLTLWLHNEAEFKSEVDESFEALKVWMTVKRNRKFRLQYWEPFFIGTKEDPEFDIRLSWEGKQNKMQMAYEMCLRNYSFHIVNNAFLVHDPGFNIYNAAKEVYRQKYIVENRKWIRIIKRNLNKTYGLKTGC